MREGQVAQVAVGIAFYSKKRERQDHMLRHVSVDNNVDDGYVITESYGKNTLESNASNNCTMAQKMSGPKPLNVQLYFNAWRLLEDCMRKMLFLLYATTIMIGFQLVVLVLSPWTQQLNFKASEMCCKVLVIGRLYKAMIHRSSEGVMLTVIL